jgi:hypothetical protein
MTLPCDTNIPPDPVIAAYLVRTKVSAHADVIALYAEWRSPNTPAAFTRKAAQVKGGWQQNSQISNEVSGVLRTIRDGKRVLVTAASLFPYLIERVIAAYPAEVKPRRQS